MPSSTRIAMLGAMALAFAAASAGAMCPINPAQYYVGNKAGDPPLDLACDYDDIQSAIQAVPIGSSCPVIINITREHTWTSQHLSIDGRRLVLAGWGDGETCQSLKNFCPISGCAQSGTQPLVTIDANDSQGGTTPGSVLSITGDSHVLLRYLEITHGHTANHDYGGGINFIGTGTLGLDTSTIDNNHAGYGGGISTTASGGNATLNLYSNTLILSNTAQFSGGGISIEGPAQLLALSDRTFVAFNHALGFDPVLLVNTGGFGGGIQILGPARADIGSPGLNGVGIVAYNQGIYGAGVAVLDNGNGEAVLRTFADGAARPAAIENNGGATNGGGIYLAGQADACLFASRIADNTAEDGAAVYYTGFSVGSDSAVSGSGIYINGGAPARLGADCGPVPVADLGGTTNCRPYDSQCSAIRDNLAQHPDNSPSAGATIWSSFGDITGARFRASGNTGTHTIRLEEGSLNLHRCLFNHNSATIGMIWVTDGFTVLDACTLVDNIVDLPYMNALGKQGNIELLDDIIVNQPGQYALVWSLVAGTFTAGYIMSNSLQNLPTGNPSLVLGTPQFVDATNPNFDLRDYHLRPTQQVALDFGASDGDIDLDGASPLVDLPAISNYLAGPPGDLGAYERQNLFYDCGSSNSIFCAGFEH
jgi:hypothetical protein